MTAPGTGRVSLSDADLARLRVRSLAYLAPKFRAKVIAVRERLEGEGFDPLIFETLRLPALQAEYFARGTSKQQDVVRSMHGHGLAVDFISIHSGWDDPKFFEAVQRIAVAQGLVSGAAWSSPNDPPHVQWGSVPGKVPDELVAAFNAGGMLASWQFVNAV